MSNGDDLASPAGRTRRRGWPGAAVTILVLFVMFVPVYLRQGQPDFPGMTLVVFTFLAWLPLTMCKRWPAAALISAVLVESVHLAVLPYYAADLQAANSIAAYQPVPLATMAAVYIFASRSRQATGWAAGAVSSLVLLFVALAFQPISMLVTDMMTVNLVLIATAAGVYSAHRRSKALRQERERLEDIRRSVVEERMRIARELHDVLAHNLTLVNAQAGVAAYLMRTNPEAAAEAMNNISGHTRAALDEVRATVGLLRDNEDSRPAERAASQQALLPTPGLTDLDALITGYRRAGNAVEKVTHGTERPVPPVADLGAYRIIQESMTNAAKHSPGAPLSVELTWTSSRLTIRIMNGAPAQPVRPPRTTHGGGHGLIGMRERALAAGGTFRATPTPTGGFEVEASFPVEAVAPAVTAFQSPIEGNTHGNPRPAG